MCGIAGYWTRLADQGVEPNLEQSLQMLHNRGPDSHGLERHVGPWGKCGLGHTRLSIIDLSPTGHQPMQSADGRFAVVYNGEIYNYRELRTELSQHGAPFRGTSDTEVLLAAWNRWGVECLPRLKGMFAFVVLDREEGTLTCVRDAFGIKPFFHAHAPWGFCFASELPATIMLRGDGAELDLQRCYDYLVYGDYDSQAATFVAGVQHLEPGTYRVLDMRRGTFSEPIRWWTPQIVERCTLSFADAADHLRHLFLESVRLHLRSDVPVGAALSGGIDSSAIVCAMRHLEPGLPIHTFSFIARGSPISEESWVRQVNDHVGATAHGVLVEPDDLARDLDDMILAQGEPFGSTSIYAQYRVYQLARECGIKVTLDGQGADELLAGYQGYPGPRVRSLLDRGSLLGATSFLRHWATWPDRSLPWALKAIVAEYVDGPVYQSLRRLAGSTPQPDWLDTEQLRERGVRTIHPRHPPTTTMPGRRLMAELAMSVSKRGLQSLLRHGDRNSMRFSVESRVPFLTTDVADFLFSLPEHFLVSPKGETKSVFRAAMRGIVPDTILNRRDKIGFATPERHWLTVLAGRAQQWARDDDAITFLRHDRLRDTFTKIRVGKTRLSSQAWRWINFYRWHALVFRHIPFL
jgi:asparagine synthase (glutamine-hydrolysing)